MRQTEKSYEEIKKSPRCCGMRLDQRPPQKKSTDEIKRARAVSSGAPARGYTRAMGYKKLTIEMLRQARKKMPMTLSLACGKDSFAAFYRKELSGVDCATGGK